ncbi:hypothetical protein NDI76_16215 [Halogeometricum sp. S1BR25-6]|uniref:Uncharacterized protein n=1 Tax=Halogeometricum salsisoli TaxID=2950536 RepID=A0ABU2GHM8_9EURY|nr:hypothetical protein [Halogeometricum sp. S1BR25-6]MDS0300292.1 hypothetical protein [Halogeometricum sp. S1BR25-6]
MTEVGDSTPTQRSVWASRLERALLGVVGAVLCVAVSSVQAVTAVNIGPLVFRPVPGLVAVAGLVGGPAAVVGSTLGYLAYRIVTGVPAVWESVGLLVLGLLTYLLWNRFGSVRHQHPLRAPPLVQAREFAVAVGIASLGAAVVSSWGYEIAGTLPFFPTALFVATEYAASAVVWGGLVLVAVPRFVSEERWRAMVDAIRPTEDGRTGESRTWVVVTAAILFAWFLLGSAISGWFQVVELVPPFHLRLRGLDPLLVFTEAGPFGRGGVILQIAVGTTLATLWILSSLRWGLLPYGRDQDRDRDVDRHQRQQNN